MTFVVGFSGPPRSGKDSIGRALASLVGSRHGIHTQLVAQSQPMRLTTYALLGVPYNEQHYEQHKDEPQPMFGNNSIRQVMIALSERHVKPLYGYGFWAKRALTELLDPRPDLVIVTDMGFASEVDVFCDEFGVDNCVWAQVDRPGHDFSKDSRSYVGVPRYSTMLRNEGEHPDQITACAERLYTRLVDRFGWVFPARS